MWLQNELKIKSFANKATCTNLIHNQENAV